MFVNQLSTLRNPLSSLPLPGDTVWVCGAVQTGPQQLLVCVGTAPAPRPSLTMGKALTSLSFSQKTPAMNLLPTNDLLEILQRRTPYPGCSEADSQVLCELTRGGAAGGCLGLLLEESNPCWADRRRWWRRILARLLLPLRRGELVRNQLGVQRCINHGVCCGETWC